LDTELRERLKLTGQQTYRDLGPSDKIDYDAAAKAAQVWFDELDEGVVTDKPFTVEAACLEYIDELRREKRDKAAVDAAWRFERGGITGDEFGRIEVAKLRPPALKKWRQELDMTNAGANRMMTSLRAALNLAVTHNRVTVAAAKAWKGGKRGAVPQYLNADGSRDIFLDLNQRQSLLAAAGSGALHDLLEAALLTGCRPGELAKLQRSTFDARTKQLTLITGKQRDGGKKQRVVPLRGRALGLFERLAKSKLPNALLLARDDGMPWTRIEWSRQIRVAAEAATPKDSEGKETKLPPGVVLYTCRHSFIAQALMDGMPTFDVAKLTGTSLAMLEKHYGKYVPSTVSERLAKVQML
jgi:integrase